MEKHVSSEHLSTVALEKRSHLLIWEVKRRTGVWVGTVLVPREAQVLLLSPAMINFRQLSLTFAVVSTSQGCT